MLFIANIDNCLVSLDDNEKVEYTSLFDLSIYREYSQAKILIIDELQVPKRTSPIRQRERERGRRRAHERTETCENITLASHLETR
jgi:hypothetical protein